MSDATVEPSDAKTLQGILALPGSADLLIECTFPITPAAATQEI